MTARSVVAGVLAIATLVLGAASGDGRTGPAAARVPATEGDFRGVYDLYVGGLKGGEIVLDARLDGARYAARAIGRTAGAVAAFYDAGFAAESTGQVTGRGLVPDHFTADSHGGGKVQKVAMRYTAGAPRAVEAEPPFDPKPWQIEPTEQAGAFDPISAALSGLALQREDALCDRTLEIFDGRKRYAFDLGEAVAQGDEIRCPAVYRRVAGFKPKQLAKPDWPFVLWYAQGPAGLWHVVRAQGELFLGIAALKLRGQ